MRAALAIVLALSFPPPIQRWVPRFERTYMRVEVGQTRSIGVPDRQPQLALRQ